MSFEIVAQQYIYETLTQSPSVEAPVFNEVEDGQDYPFITIGEATHTDASTDAILLQNISVSVHVWSREKGTLETKRIQSQIFNALNRTKSLTYDYVINAVDFDSSQTFLDSDNLTRHGVQTFNILMQKR